MKIVDVAKPVGAMLSAPIRMRRNPPAAPTQSEHYEIPELAKSAATTTNLVAYVPRAQTPPGRWKDWPPLVLVGSDEPIVEGAPDLRGVWQAYKGPMKGHIERNEQAGNRVVITGGGVVHDLCVDGTLDSALRDEGIGGARITVVARYEDGRLNLYPNDKVALVTRYRDGEDLVWRWGPYTSRLRRLTAP